MARYQRSKIYNIGSEGRFFKQGGNYLAGDAVVGTRNNQDVVIITGNTERVRVTKDGNVSVSGLTPDRAMLVDGSGFLVSSAVTGTELSYLSGVTSNIQDQLNSISGGISGLTANRAVATDGSGHLVSSGATDTELSYLSGATSNIQTQLNSLSGGTLSGSGTANRLVKWSSSNSFTDSEIFDEIDSTQVVLISNKIISSADPSHTVTISLGQAGVPAFMVSTDQNAFSSSYIYADLSTVSLAGGSGASNGNLYLTDSWAGLDTTGNTGTTNSQVYLTPSITQIRNTNGSVDLSPTSYVKVTQGGLVIGNASSVPANSAFYLRDSGSFSSLFNIKGTGNSDIVSIGTGGAVIFGTSSQAVSVTVNGDGTSSGTTIFLIQDFNGTAFYRVTSDGKMALGTSSTPTSRLFVVGSGTTSATYSVKIHDGAGTPNLIVCVRDDGKVGVGTATPDTTLHVVGSFKYVDANQASGKILTSDSAGASAWKNPNISILSNTTSGHGSPFVSGSGWAADSISYTLPANTMANDGDVLEVSSAFSCSVTNSYSVRLIVLSTSATVTISSGDVVVFYFKVIRRSSGTQYYTYHVFRNGSIVAGGGGALTADLTTSNIIKGQFTGTNGDGSSDMIQQTLLVQLLRNQ